MKYRGVILISALLITLIGCGNSDLRNKVDDNSARLEKAKRDLSAKIEAASGRLAAVERDMLAKVTSFEESVDSIKRAIRELTDGEVTFREGENTEDERIEELTRNVDDLKQQLEALRTELAKVKEQAASTSPETAVPDYHTAYRDMGDPAKLAEKLDSFVKEHAPKLDESGQRLEFETDMAAYKAEATREYTTEELLDKHKESIRQRMEDATNEQMREYYERQIRMLDEASGDVLEMRLTNFRRYDNMRKLSTIAQKYSISRSEMRKYGLHIYGGGWSPKQDEGEN